MKRRIISLLLVVLIIVPAFTFCVNASTIIGSGTCGDNLIWTLDDKGVLTISGTGSMSNYFYSSPWRSYTVKTVDIKAGVTSIGDYAFFGCASLTSITIPNSVTSIGSSAFSYCSSLTSIKVEDGNAVYHSSGNCLIETASKTLISGCQNSNIPNDGSVTSIGEFAFYSCTSLTSITIPDSVTSIGAWAFTGCTSLTSITISDSVTSIGDDAFSGCTSLTSITIPDSVTSIGKCVFSNCTSLTSITIPDSVTSIDGSAFGGCSSLTSIKVEDGNTVYHSSGNCLIETVSKTLIVGCKNSNIPNDGSVTSIGEHAFDGCESLTSITIPDSVTSIGNCAFSGCASLTSITIPDSVTSIGNYTFRGCTSLTSITIPDSVTSIGGSVFSGCTSLTSITIPDSVTSIGGSAFTGCTSLTSITIPNSVTSIGDYAFRGCTSLTSITIPDSVTSIGVYAFSDCTSLTSIMLPNSVTSIGNYAFYNCTSLTSITIPNSVTSIGEGAFMGCTSLTSITIPNSVTSIGNYAFYICTSLTSITIPDSVTRIGGAAFYGCSSLETVYYTGTVEDRQNIYIDSWRNDELINANWVYEYVEQHNYIAVVSEPTCTEKGFTTYTCSKCGDSYIDDEVDALGHDYKSVVTAPTCTEKGYTTYTCTRCGDSYVSDETAALGHTWDSGVITKEATVDEEGTITYKCTVCVETKTEVIPKLKPEPEINVVEKFSDVEYGKWYTEAVSYAVNNGLFNGTSDTTFEPNTDMTRAMLVSVLYRMEGSPEVTFKNTFSDVESGKWYSNAVIWAAENGIVTGVGAGMFDPNGKVTREQMAAILFRYTQFKGGDTDADANLNNFSDGSSTSGWAKDAVEWAVGEGLISGTGNNKLSPKGNASRAQVATILMRYENG